eukprot:354619-Chlamydomonas_euryale.AAC.11
MRLSPVFVPFSLLTTQQALLAAPSVRCAPAVVRRAALQPPAHTAQSNGHASRSYAAPARAPWDRCGIAAASCRSPRKDTLRIRMQWYGM